MLALALAAGGHSDDAAAVVDTVDAISGGTYMDRVVTHWARGFVSMQRGDAPGAVEAFESACALTEATDLRVDIAIATLARGRALEALGSHDASTVLVQASDRLQALDIEAPGWETVFALACAHRPDDRVDDQSERVSG